MELTWGAVLISIIQIIGAGGGAAVILYGIFAKWGEKWLDSRFATRLQELQHLHERELESVRYAVQSTFSRITKIHEREFEVLPKIWLMIQDTLGQAAHAVGATIIQLPSFRNMADEDIEDYFQSVGFSESQKKQILRSSDPDERREQCSQVLMYRNMFEAKEKQRLLNNYIIENRVFMTPELDALMSDVSLALATGLGSFEIGKRSHSREIEMEGFHKITNLNGKLPAILKAIQERLCHPAAATKPPID
jgi:hypothetical protein